MTDKFLFVAGVQKGGTTWLATYLRNRPDVWIPTSEMHVFTVEFLGRATDATHAERKVRLMRAKADRQGFTLDPAVIEARLKQVEENVALQRQPETYGHYFRARMTDRPYARLTGEKTPTYTLLKAEHWLKIRERLNASGFDPAVVVSFRDPVERAISHFRMMQAQSVRDGRVKVALDPLSALEWLLGGDRPARADYRQAVASISAVFPDDRRLFLLFEDLFNERSVRRVTDLVGLPYLPADFDENVNPASFDWTCPPDVRQRLREAFDPTYVFAREMFGAEVIDRLWKNA